MKRKQFFLWVRLVLIDCVFAFSLIAVLDVLFWHHFLDLLYVALPLSVLRGTIAYCTGKIAAPSLRSIHKSKILISLTYGRIPKHADLIKWSLVVVFGNICLSAPMAVIAGVCFPIQVLKALGFVVLLVGFWSGVAISGFLREFSDSKASVGAEVLTG